MLSVTIKFIMLNACMLCVIMLNVTMANVMAPPIEQEVSHLLVKKQLSDRHLPPTLLGRTQSFG